MYIFLSQTLLIFVEIYLKLTKVRTCWSTNFFSLLFVVYLLFFLFRYKLVVRVLRRETVVALLSFCLDVANYFELGLWVELEVG